MVSLQDFKTYPGPGETCILEKDGRLCTMPSAVNIAAYEHPMMDINISRELCHFGHNQRYDSAGDDNAAQHSSFNRFSSSASPLSPSANSPPLARHVSRSSISAGSILKPIAEPLIKRCSRIFFEDGLVAALQEAAATGPPTSSAVRRTNLSKTPASTAGQLHSDNEDADDAEEVNHTCGRLLVASLAGTALRVIDVLGRAQLYVQPQQRAATVALNAVRLSQTRDWPRSLIRTMAWHSHCMRLAVAACDDSVRIYTDAGNVNGGGGGGLMMGGGANLVPVLKTNAQRGISTLAWRPFTNELAVGCHNGVLIWSWDPNLHSSRTLSQPIHLMLDHHEPVTAIAWSGDGRLLATASCADPDVQLWDVDQQQRRPLRRIGAPCALLSFSPSGHRMFTSTVGCVFRVWSTDDWTPERWTVPFGAIQSAAWSPCGGYLLFVTTDEPYIYSLCFADEQLFANSSTPKAAVPLVDLTRHTVGTNDIGGRPQSLRWDAAGKRLAVSFKDTAAVAIFLTTIGRTKLSVVPDCLLVGLSAEVPHHIAFQPPYAGQPETVLTIGWSTGRVQFFPFL